MARVSILRLLAVIGVSLLTSAFAADGDLPNGAVGRQVPDQTAWLIRLPASDKVVFRGMLSGKGAGADKGAPMMYAAPGLAGFFAGLITHAAISSAVLSHQQRAEQEEADQVLVPYRPVLDAASVTRTAQLGVEKMTRGGPKKTVSAADTSTQGAWLIESSPVFTLTQDERAIVLDNAIVVHSPEAPPAVVYKGMVRVVSHPKPAGDEQSPAADAWMADEGRALQQETAALWAESLDMVLAELGKGPAAAVPAAQKTVRFPEGGVVKVERASLIEERCDRLVIKTLRGWLMSVPAKAAEAATAAPSCGTQAIRATP